MIDFPKDFKLIFSALSGSRLYGTSTKDSDYDERGVFIPSKSYFLGFNNRIEQFEDKQSDTTYFELRKFLHLACENNPNVVELLFIPESKMTLSTPEWEEIINYREYFLSTKSKFTFTGYAHSQFNRIKLHRRWLMHPPTKQPERKDFGLLESRSTLTKNDIGAFNVLLALKLENIKEFHPLKEQIETMNETYDFKALCQQFRDVEPKALQEIIPITDEFIEIIQKENAYAVASQQWNQYQNWKKNRNPERAKMEEKYFFDLKHASHLCRLITEGEELLTKGTITFPRPDAEFLIEVKNGKYKYEEISEILENYDEKFNKLYETSTLPRTANRNKVDELCIKITGSFIGISEL